MLRKKISSRANLWRGNVLQQCWTVHQSICRELSSHLQHMQQEAISLIQSRKRPQYHQSLKMKLIYCYLSNILHGFKNMWPKQEMKLHEAYRVKKISYSPAASISNRSLHRNRIKLNLWANETSSYHAQLNSQCPSQSNREKRRQTRWIPRESPPWGWPWPCCWRRCSWQCARLSLSSGTAPAGRRRHYPPRAFLKQPIRKQRGPRGERHVVRQSGTE